MSRVLTFSTKFPAYHPRKGEPTFFVEKIFKSLFLMKSVPPELVDSYNFEIMNDDSVVPKHHTIRAGNRWKVGDKFSPRVWSGKPYQSKQIIIASDIEVKKVWSIWYDENGWWINGNSFYALERLAQNDGLSLTDFLDWFNIHPKKKGETFTGQIICYNENISYE